MGWRFLPTLALAMSQLKLAPGATLPAKESSCNGVCGRRPLAGSHSLLRVLGGTDALPGTWPWQVSFQLPTRWGFVNTCGGTLLSSRWVLSAAHCFQIEEEIPWYKVVLGINRISSPGPDAQKSLIKRVINHQLYQNELNKTGGGIKHDISLVELAEPVSCSDYIQPACLPDKSVTVSKLVQCSISGWGTMEVKTQRQPDILQEGVVKLIPHHTCSSKLWWNTRINAENLCAGHEKGDITTCQGDSGGPLMCREERSERYWVVGVTSWGPQDCVGLQKPGVFTATQHYVDWITRMTKENLFQASHQPLLAQVWPPAKPLPTSPIQPSTQNVMWGGPKPPPMPILTPGPRPPPFPQLTPGPRPPPVMRPTQWNMSPGTKWGIRRTYPAHRPWTGPAIWGLTQPFWTSPRKRYHRKRPLGWYGLTWSSHQTQLRQNQRISPPGYYTSYSWNPGFAQPGSQSPMPLPPRGPQSG